MQLLEAQTLASVDWGNGGFEDRILPHHGEA